MSQKDDCCEYCIYARDFEDMQKSWYPEQTLCKRFPPKCKEISSGQYVSEPRVVWKHDWCGEFARKLE